MNQIVSYFLLAVLFDLALLSVGVGAIGAAVLTLFRKVRESKLGSVVHIATVVSLPVLIGSVILSVGVFLLSALGSS